MFFSSKDILLSKEASFCDKMYHFFALDLNILVRLDLVTNCQDFALTIFDCVNTISIFIIVFQPGTAHYVFFENYTH